MKDWKKAGWILVAAFAACCLVTGTLTAGDGYGKSEKKAATKFAGDPYPLATCAVSGQALGSMGEAVIENVDGREVRLCCGGCTGKLKADPKKYLAKVDAKIIETQKARYPLDVCLMMGEALEGEHAETTDVVVGNRLFRLCCGGCVRGLNKNPAKAFKKLDAAVVAKQSKNYPLKTCAVSGEPLGEGARNMVIANQLVKLCCGGCEKAVKKNPAKILAKMAKADPKEKM